MARQLRSHLANLHRTSRQTERHQADDRPAQAGSERKPTCLG
jgi:hypothetical protein